MTDDRIGWGGELHVSTDNTEANLTELSEVRDVSFPQDEADEHEVTHLKSPGRRTRAKISSAASGGYTTPVASCAPSAPSPNRKW